MSIVKSIVKRIVYPTSYNNEAYIRYLRKKGIEIGKGCVFFSPTETHVDTQRPHMLKIGDYAKITRNVTILCHDYSRGVYCNMRGMGNAGEGRPTLIGNNVFIGMNAIILIGAHIDDNSIIGAGAVVMGNYPAGAVIAGNPAKVICTIDDFYHRRKAGEIDAAKLYVRRFRERFKRNPDIYEMTNAFSWLYLPRGGICR